jgi:hypothetical protein
MRCAFPSAFYKAKCPYHVRAGRLQAGTRKIVRRLDDYVSRDSKRVRYGCSCTFVHSSDTLTLFLPEEIPASEVLRNSIDPNLQCRNARIRNHSDCNAASSEPWKGITRVDVWDYTRMTVSSLTAYPHVSPLALRRISTREASRPVF